ncbi:hypothetical protein M885DRAFT_543754 [Pelagophyceae sp. CCMP2097]|nr:hypothetical protein M885DRAFT_543754 [Pelagophyceae sp. CCMP2097]|mmetsp:Transcript_26452/g.88991  ORF Transcript_26452/g.88991 Transcript_26452/m.88991 type:complete len:280 (-) Transcript_26452:52-891(-)
MPLRVLCVAALARPTGGLSAPVTGGLSAPAAGGLSASAAGGLLAPAKWNVVLDLGRSEESRMPADWAASGARFFVQSEVELVYDAGADDERKFLGRETRKLAASPGTFTGLGGKFEVAIRPDAEWALSADEPRRLRFWLDFSDAVANSRGVELPAEKLFFTTDVYDPLRVSEAKRTLAAAKQAVFAAEAAVGEGGPRSAANDARKALQSLEKRLPATSNLTPGPIPGLAGGALVDSGKTAVVSVKRRTLFGQRFVAVDTCSLTPVLEGAELAASKRLYY